MGAAVARNRGLLLDHGRNKSFIHIIVNVLVARSRFIANVILLAELAGVPAILQGWAEDLWSDAELETPPVVRKPLTAKKK